MNTYFLDFRQKSPGHLGQERLLAVVPESRFSCRVSSSLILSSLQIGQYQICAFRLGRFEERDSAETSSIRANSTQRSPQMRSRTGRKVSALLALCVLLHLRQACTFSYHCMCDDDGRCFDRVTEVVTDYPCSRDRECKCVKKHCESHPFDTNSQPNIADIIVATQDLNQLRGFVVLFK